MPAPRSPRYISSELLVDNPWHRYRKDRFRQRDGSVGEYYHVDMSGAVGILPRYRDGSVVLLRTYRYLLDAWIWEMPFGGIQPGEDPLEVAKKELREEAGLRAARWQEVGRFAPYKGVSNEIDHFYLAEELRDGPRDLEPSEEIEVHRMEFAAARSKLYEQELIDGQSLTCLALYEHWLARQGETGGA